MSDEIFPYYLHTAEFIYNDLHYKVCLTEELFPEDDALEATGNYLGILIAENRGTMTFTMERDAHLKWQMSNKLINLGITDEIIKEIEKLQQIIR